MLAKIETYNDKKLPGISDKRGSFDGLVVPHVDNFLEGSRIEIRKCRIKKLKDLRDTYGINLARHWVVGNCKEADEEYEVILLSIHDKTAEVVETYVVFGEAYAYVMNNSGKTIDSIKSNGYNLKA